MNKTLHISTSIDQPQLFENIVKKLVTCRPDYGIRGLKMPSGFKAFDSSSTEVYVSGTVDFKFLINKNKKVYTRMPFITIFHITCIKTVNRPLRLALCSSLS